MEELVRSKSAVILDKIAGVERDRARNEAEISALMLDFEDETRHEAEKNEDPKVAAMEILFAADELGLALLVPTRTVQVRLAQARRVRGRMPLTWLACRRGDVDGYRMQLIAEAAAKLVRPQSVMALDARVGDYAAGHTSAQLRNWCRRFVARTEPDQIGARKKQEWADRSVWFDHGSDGVSWMHSMLKTPDAVRLDRLLRKLAERRADNDPDLTVQQARADVAAELLLGRADANGRPTGRTNGGATIGVVVPVLSLAGLTDEPGESFDGQFMLDAETVRALAAETGTLFYRIFTDPLGRILDVTELGRYASTKLRIATQIRDGTCGFPTCSRPAEEADLDHPEPVPYGPTAGWNQRHLCRRHHRMKTYRIVGTTMAGSRHTWHLSSGVSVDSENRRYEIRGQSTPSRAEYDFATWLVEAA